MQRIVEMLLTAFRSGTRRKLGVHQPLVNSYLNSKSHNTFGSEQVLYPWIPQHVLLPFR
ncbi:hypothetical protein OCF68_03755 [Bacillus cereus]|nr:hypothetical protein [Bacillus cereus]